MSLLPATGNAGAGAGAEGACPIAAQVSLPTLLSRRQRRPVAVSTQMWLPLLQSAFDSQAVLHPTAGDGCS